MVAITLIGWFILLMSSFLFFSYDASVTMIISSGLNEAILYIWLKIEWFKVEEKIWSVLMKSEGSDFPILRQNWREDLNLLLNFCPVLAQYLKFSFMSGQSIVLRIYSSNDRFKIEDYSILLRRRQLCEQVAPLN